MRINSSICSLVIATVIATAGAPAASAQSLHRQPIGTEVEGKARIGRYEVPLPPGRWTLIAAHETISRPIDGSSGRATGHAILARIEGNRLVGYISALGPMTPNNVHRLWDMECRRTDLYFVESDPNNNPQIQTCFSVYHMTRTWTAAPNLGPLHTAAYEWLNARPEIRKPSTMIVSRHSNARNSDYVQVEYNFSPESYGFAPSRDRSWAGNDWHRDKLKHDPTRDAFAQAVLAWAKTTQKQVLDGLIHRSTTAGAALGFSPAAPEAPSTQAAARPLPAGHVMPAVGTRFVSAGGHFDVVRVEGMTITTVNAANASTMWQVGGLLPLNASSRFDRAIGESIFPLALEKKVSFEQRAAEGTDAWRQTLEVVRNEDLTVDGRTYRTFVLEGRTEAIGPGMAEFVRKRTLWYSPELGWLIRFREEQLAGPPQRMNSWEVVRVVRPQ